MLNNYCHICNQSPPICLIAKFCAKIRILKFGTENALFRWFGQQFWKAILIFSINAPEFALFQSLVQKVKIIKFGTKNVWFPYFETGIWKYYCHIWNQHPRISLVVMFGSKKKIPKFGKIAYTWLFLERNLEIILSYFKSALSKLFNWIIFWNNENGRMWDQKCLIWVILG